MSGGTFALILYLIDEIIRDPSWAGANPVQWETVERAHKIIVDFTLPHAYNFYGNLEKTHERVRQIASWILTSGEIAIIPSDLTANINSLKGFTLLQINQAVSPLVAGGWLLPEDNTPVCRYWRVAPGVHTQFAARAAGERSRKAALRKLMGAVPKEP
jgi:hypothetical protein